MRESLDRIDMVKPSDREAMDDNPAEVSILAKKASDKQSRNLSTDSEVMQVD